MLLLYNNGAFCRTEELGVVKKIMKIGVILFRVGVFTFMRFGEEVN